MLSVGCNCLITNNLAIFHFLFFPSKFLEMIEKSELFTCPSPVLSECFNMCYLSSPLWTFTLSAMRLPLLPLKFLSHNSLGHFTWYTTSCWWSNLLLSLIWKQVLKTSVYTIWVFTVSGSSLCSLFPWFYYAISSFPFKQEK